MSKNKTQPKVTKDTDTKPVAKQTDFYSVRKHGQYAYQLIKLGSNGEEILIGPANVAAVIMGALEDEIMSKLVSGL